MWWYTSVVSDYEPTVGILIQTTMLTEHVPRDCRQLKKLEGKPGPHSASECLEGVPVNSILSTALWKNRFLLFKPRFHTKFVETSTRLWSLVYLNLDVLSLEL